MGMIRTIVEERQKNVAVMDVFSKLVQERIIFIDDVIDDDLANGVIAQLLYLDSLDKKKPINIYINTLGGNVYSGLAIYDIAEKITAPIRTVAMGKCCSMGVPLMLMGSERCATKRAKFMIHQVSGGTQGQLTDMKISLKEADDLEKELYTIISERTGKSYEQIAKDCDRDYWLNAEEALEYGIINKIL
jgi:ATP-dependent Clp protease protease subunit